MGFWHKISTGTLPLAILTDSKIKVLFEGYEEHKVADLGIDGFSRKVPTMLWVKK